MTKRRKHYKGTRARRGMLPGEYVKRSLVTVPFGLEAKVMVPDLAQGQDLHYVVTTRRTDNIYKVEIETRGQRYLLPHRVVEQIERHIKAIQDQQRSDAARDRMTVIEREDAQPQSA